jgi:precorrin-2 dehydrogenase / sirohydrochlorin ferrochelatase
MSATPLFPIFVKLADKYCLVVGGTTLLESKIEGLLGSGARVRVVANDVSEGIQRLAAEGKLWWERRSFEVSDLDDIDLVVAADPDQRTNELVFAEAEVRRVLCNVVDQPEHCNFFYPAVVRRGHLQIAISTGGLAPSLASRIRKELEQQFGPEYVDWVNALGKARGQILQFRAPSEKRTRLLKRIASKHSLKQFRQSQPEGEGAL